MNPKKAVKDLEKQLRKDPGNLVLRIRLAAAFHAAGEMRAAVDLYRSVAMAYYQQNRIDQAIAVCHSLLEIAPDHHDTRMLLLELDSRRAAQVQQQAQPAPAPAPSPMQDRSVSVMTPMPMTPPNNASGSFARSSVFDTTGSFPRKTPTGKTPAVQRSRRPSGFEADPFTPSNSEPDAFAERPRAARGRGETRPLGSRNGVVTTPPSNKRFPLPLMRTMNGQSPPPTEPPPIEAPTRRPMQPRQTAEPRSKPPTREVDEDAATRIAWPGEKSGDVALDGQTSEMPVLRGAPSRPPPARGRASQPPPTRGAPVVPRGRAKPPSVRPPEAPDTEPFTVERYPRGERARPASGGPPVARATSEGKTVPRGRAAHQSGVEGEHEQEPTVYDDNQDLARAFAQPHPPLDLASAPARFALLASLPEPAVEQISAGVIRHRIGSGEIVLREGDPGDSCYLVGHGEVRVLKRDPLAPRGDLMEVSRLAEGELFGEVAMMSDRRRHATVQAVTDSEVLEIPGAVLRQVASRFPEVDVFLQKFYRDRIISTLVGTAPFFRPLEPPQRAALIAHFQFSRADAGQHIIVEGERSGCFYLVVLGTVDITKRVSERRQVLLATLGEGSYFGEMSLLRGDVARASVTATGPTEFAVLPAKNFYSLVASHPILWDQVRHEAHRRELEMVQIVTGVTGSV